MTGDAQTLAKQLSSLEEKEAQLREEVLDDARAIMSARQVMAADHGRA